MLNTPKSRKNQVRHPISALSYVSAILTQIMFLAGMLFMLSALTAFIFIPVTYDTIHLQDTFFFAELGWRVVNGSEPVLDFGHFYGGVVAHYVAWAFVLFGISIKSIDYASVMMLTTALGLAAVVSWRRITLFSAFALSLVLFSCLLTRVPLEQLTAIQRPMSAHSFIYNRFAIALAIVVILFALLPARARTADMVAAICCGATAYVIVLIKPTFVTFVPAFFLALAVSGRWLSLGLAILGCLGAMMILDPGMLRVLGSFEYAVSSAGANTSVSGMILKTIAVCLVHPLVLLGLFVTMAIMIKSQATGALTMVFSTFILTTGFVGMVATMGWPGDIGQQTLPLTAILILSCYEWSRTSTHNFTGMQSLFKVLATSIVVTFSIPHLAQSSISGVIAIMRAPMVHQTGTPLDSYFAWSDEFRDKTGAPFRAPVPLEQQISDARAHLDKGRPLNVGVEYIMIIDGIKLLQELPDIAKRRIAGEYGAFAFALQTQPVEHFPAWVNATTPELASDTPLPEEVDTLILRKNRKSAVSERLTEKMADEFTLCLQSQFWQIYLRSLKEAVYCVPHVKPASL